MLQKMRALFVGCVTALWLIQAASSQSQGLRIIEQASEDQQSILPLSILPTTAPQEIDKEIDVPLEFGFRIIQGVHTRLEECDHNKTRVIRRYQAKFLHLQKYFNDTEKIISKPEFEELSSENRVDIEENFRNAFTEIEAELTRKLHQLRVKCDTLLESFINRNVITTVLYAEDVIQRDPAQFMQLTFEVSSYSLQLRKLMSWCPNPRKHSQIIRIAEGVSVSVKELCQGDLTLVLSLIDRFLEEADKIFKSYIDDEDFAIYISGDGEYDNELGSGDGETDTEVVKKPAKPDMVVTTDSPKPTKPPKGHRKPLLQTTTPSMDKDKEKKTTSASITSLSPGFVLIYPLEQTAQSPVTEDTGDDTTDKELSQAELDKAANNFFNSLEPGPVLIKDDQLNTTPETESELGTEPTTLGSFEVTPDVLVSKAFEDVNQMIKDGQKHQDKSDNSDYDETEEEYLDSDSDSEEDSFDSDQEEDRDENEFSDESSLNSLPKKSQSKSSSPQIHGSLELDLPGVDSEVDVQIGSDGVRIDAGVQQDPSVESVMFDNDNHQSRNRHHPHHHDNDDTEDDPTESSSFLGYILTYFFVTLATLLLFAILMFIIAIAFVRLKRRSLKDTSLLSEDQKVAVMKQSGYVNPTYKFFDNVDDV